MNITQTIAQQLKIQTRQVEATIELLDEKATVPFIARYRKEVTGGLSDTQLRELVEKLQYLRELEERRNTILKSITEQKKLTPELEKAILAADNKTTLEDLYLPYKPKRHTKAQIAREAGLESLALALWQNPELNPLSEAEKYLSAKHNIDNATAALEGARHILMEIFSEQAPLLELLRRYFWDHGLITSRVVKDKEQEGIKFQDYFTYSEAIKKIPSHRILALLRGRKEGMLQLNLIFPNDSHTHTCHQLIAKQFNIPYSQNDSDNWLKQTVEWTWKIKLYLKLELEIMNTLREHAEEAAINVFKDNLSNLLMSAPAGNRVVMGLDPGLRTGVKVVVVDGTGKFLEYSTIFPHPPRNQWDESIATLTNLCQKHSVDLIAIGNGTASRETERLVNELIKKNNQFNLTKIVVSEAGASVYSASQLAAEEFPDLDVTIRGAISIARRVQDPLAELVKIDPKSIGVGQYQHDVNQVKLTRGLDAVIEDCVNAVGADVNTASVKLLSSISGLNENVAKNIVNFRETHGRFKNRQQLKQVPRFGEKTYEQAIGFLRIIGGENPLDASAVHPESYPLVDQILKTIDQSIKQVMGNSKLLNELNPQQFSNEQFGLPTIKDILHELNKPGRDPRPEFKTATFQENIENLTDLKSGMILEGVITNVANFGAFVDIGVHQDGLVHISEIANHFVSDIQQVIKVGQIVKVKVLEVDIPRKRISLSMKDDQAETSTKVKKMTKSASSFEQKPLSDLATKLKKALE